jgi:hypothetical protein
MTKRRSAGRGNIEKIKLRSGKTAYRGWLTVGYRLDAEGKKRPIRRTVQAPTKGEVEDGLDGLRARYRVGVDLDAERMRLRILFDKWLAVVEAGMAQILGLEGPALEEGNDEN